MGMRMLNFNDLLINPQEVITPLSEKEIKRLIIDAINAYFDRKITLNKLVQTAQLIKKCASIPLNGLTSDIDEIISLAFVKEMLSDIVKDLNDKSYE